jgi:hypothetical protein
MSAALRHIVAEHGYALIPQHTPALGTIEAVSLLGSVLRLEGFSEVQVLRPNAASIAPPNTYSGNFGTGEFPIKWTRIQEVVTRRVVRQTETLVTVQTPILAGDCDSTHPVQQTAKIPDGKWIPCPGRSEVGLKKERGGF